MDFFLVIRVRKHSLTTIRTAFILYWALEIIQRWFKVLDRMRTELHKY